MHALVSYNEFVQLIENDIKHHNKLAASPFPTITPPPVKYPPTPPCHRFFLPQHSTHIAHNPSTRDPPSSLETVDDNSTDDNYLTDNNPDFIDNMTIATDNTIHHDDFYVPILPDPSPDFTTKIQLSVLYISHTHLSLK